MGGFIGEWGVEKFIFRERDGFVRNYIVRYWLILIV